MKRAPHAIVAAVAEKHGVTALELRSRRREPAVDRARLLAYKALKTELKWSPGQIGVYFDRTRQAIHKGLKAVDEITLNPEEMADLYRKRLNYLSGQSILYEVCRKLELKSAEAITLSILIRNAPRPLTLAAISELYDHAWQGINAREKFICETTVKSSISYIRRHMAERGLPVPIDTIKPSGYVLSGDFALWVRENLSIPVMT